MTVFEKIFGMDFKDVKAACVLLPCLNKSIINEFGVKTFKRGKLYGCANTKNLTLVHTGIGAAFVADAVLHLKEANVKDVFLFGSCGSLGRLDIGELVVPYECLAYESFSEMLNNPFQKAALYYPDESLLDIFLKNDKKSAIHKVRCATTSSLKLEEQYLKKWEEGCVDIVDMECSVFYSAAKFVGLRALSLFYVSDVISKKPFYEKFGLRDILELSRSIKDAVKIIKETYV